MWGRSSRERDDSGTFDSGSARNTEPGHEQTDSVDALEASLKSAGFGSTELSSMWTLLGGLLHVTLGYSGTILVLALIMLGVAAGPLRAVLVGLPAVALKPLGDRLIFAERGVPFSFAMLIASAICFCLQ